MGKLLAIVGIGNWGAKYLKTIVNSSIDEVVLIISSKSKATLDKIAATKAIVLPSIELIDSYVDLIDGIIVATPPEVRPEILKKILKLGIPVLSEKPLSLNVGSSYEIIALARKTKTNFIECFIHIYSWPFLTIVSQLQKNKPIQIETVAENDGPFRDYSPLMDYAPHDIAMILIIFGRIPTSINLRITDYINKLSFSAEIFMNFSELGSAKCSISNIRKDKKRQLKVISHNDDWTYDDCIENKLIHNGCIQDSSLSEESPMQLLLEQFCSRKEFYSNEKLLWLSEAVATILHDINTQCENIFIER